DQQQGAGTEADATQRAAGHRGYSQIVHLRALCRRAVPPLAGRYRLAAVQRRGVTELRPIAHGRVDVEHGPLPDEGVPADRDRPGLDSPRMRPVALEERLLADDRPRADGEQIGAHRYAPGEDHDARADLRAERPQVEHVEGGP